MLGESSSIGAFSAAMLCVVDREVMVAEMMIDETNDRRR